MIVILMTDIRRNKQNQTDWKQNFKIPYTSILKNIMFLHRWEDFS